jgi:guanidinopropionase
MSSCAGCTEQVAPYEFCRIGDAGDAPVNPIDLADSLRRIEAFFAAIVKAGAVPLSAGGDHLITLPILRSVAKGRPVGLIQFDSHSDTNDHYFGANPYTHGTPFRRAIEEGLIEPRRSIQIGIRGSLYDPHDQDYALDAGIRMVTIEEFFDLGVEAVSKEIRRVAGDGPVYVTFDVDSLDPAYAPGTGTPEIGGFSTHEAQRMVRSLQGLDICGADVVEVSPPFDPTGNTALVGATMMFELLCVLADQVRPLAGRTTRP